MSHKNYNMYMEISYGTVMGLTLQIYAEEAVFCTSHLQ